MRQAGMKPKSHSSGTYWVRANARNGKGKTENKQVNGDDLNGDGIVDAKDTIIKLWLWALGGFLGFLLFLFVMVM